MGDGSPGWVNQPDWGGVARTDRERGRTADGSGGLEAVGRIGGKGWADCMEGWNHGTDWRDRID